MPRDPLILSFDTSAAHIAAALRLGDEILAAEYVEMAKGQAENLLPFLQDLCAENDVTFENFAAIGVGVGPGNFTGIRISVAAARGMALGLKIPAIGVSWFDAMGPNAVVKGPRDLVYYRSTPGAEPTMTTLIDLPCAPASVQSAADIPPLEFVKTASQVAAERLQKGEVARPKPMYIKPADAAPSKVALISITS